MADYYSILKKTLSGLPKNTAENRQAVYGRARQAIDKQLRGLEPTPPEEAIARQMKLLEEAIETVESEFLSAAQAPAAQPPARQAPATQPQVRTAPPPQVQSRAPQPQVPQQRAPQAPERYAPEPRAPQAPQSRAPQPQAPQSRAPQPQAPQQRAPQPQAPMVATRRDAPPPAYDATLDELDDYDRAPQGRQRVSALGREKRRGGWFVTLVVSVVLLAILAAGGYALWRNKDPLIEALGLQEFVGQEATTVAQDDPVDEPAPTATDDKEDVRLDQSGETVPGQADQDASGEPIREAGQSTPPADEPAATEPDDEPVQVNPVGQAGDTQQADADQPLGGESPSQTNAPPAIAQKAYLYEEGGTGAGATRDNAAIVWSLEERSPGEGLPPEAVIVGQFDVPGRGLVMQITIRRNLDEALPASHIIELRFETPPDFSGGEIDNVARFVMKSSEQARGEGLIAVPAKIDTGLFLIALNNLAQAQETNRKLLTDSSWIDIPVGYTSGRRALVTLEKGAIGEKVFNDALADWDSR